METKKKDIHALKKSLGLTRLEKRKILTGVVHFRWLMSSCLLALGDASTNTDHLKTFQTKYERVVHNEGSKNVSIESNNSFQEIFISSKKLSLC
jgi:hypothetical protein